MIDPHAANRILQDDPAFRRLWRRFNALGIWRFVVYVAAAIIAIVSGINHEYGWLIGGLIVSFIIVMTLNYQRMITRAHQQRRAIELGLITEDDLN